MTKGKQQGGTSCYTKCVVDGRWVAVKASGGDQCWVRMDHVSWQAGGHALSTGEMHQKCVREQGEKRYKDLMAEADRQMKQNRAKRCVTTVTRALALPGIADKTSAEKLQRMCRAMAEGEGLIVEAEKDISTEHYRAAATKILLLSTRGVGHWKSNQRKLLLRLYGAQTKRYLKALQRAVVQRPSFDLVIKEELDRVPVLKTRKGQRARAHELKLPRVLERTDLAKRTLSVAGMRFNNTRTAPPTRVIVDVTSCPPEGCPDEPERHQVSWCLAKALQRYVLCKQLALSLKGGVQ